MENILCVYKPVTKTPVQVIEQLKQQYPVYKDQTISYAGRLDPMAEGLLLLLVGEENKKRKEYEKLTKTYKFDILLGVATDTYDMLGKVITNKEEQGTWNTKDIRTILASYIGKNSQPYPPYSSKAVQGKPLYWWARNNKLEEIQIPTNDIAIYTATVTEEKTITTHALQQYITQRVSLVEGDFRQEDILQTWDSFFKDNSRKVFPVITCQVSCSSGTYIRSLAHNVGQQLGCGAIALRILRTQVGDYTPEDILKLTE